MVARREIPPSDGGKGGVRPMKPSLAIRGERQPSRVLPRVTDRHHL